ncbi:MAG: glycosyltransferase family 1 protein [Hyphomicrobiaceae bacterium]|nr:glycosyltransferase family 1 protein [Hyphomicrobiaceae bacterium]MCC0024592.1 glycosyltransferase family 1 protein [Hyphomicrobiaceae bacterium]
MSRHLTIISDAWFPQINGAVRTLDAVKRDLESRDWHVDMITPDRFFSFPMPTYPEIRLGMVLPGMFKRLLDPDRAEYVHIATEAPVGFAGRRFCVRHGLKFTTSYHTRFPEYMAARVRGTAGAIYAYLKWFHRPAASTLVPTASMAAELSEHGFENLRVWTRGVDPDNFHPGPKTLFKNLEGPHLLYAGRLSVEKNVEAFLGLDVPGSKIVVGAGPDLANLRRAYPDVHFLGKLEGAQLRAAYQSADVLVFPSRTETFGNVMLEALACGTPVAAFPVTGPIDVITDPGAGALDENLAFAVEKALTASRADAHRFSKRFTWERTAELFENQLTPARPGEVPAPRPVNAGRVSRR